MAQVKTSELAGAALDWAVAKCDEASVSYENIQFGGKALGMIYDHPDGYCAKYSPSSNWLQGGPIIERERFDISPDRGSELWLCWSIGNVQCSSGNTPLQAAMRCYVASKLGDVVEIPEELC